MVFYISILVLAIVDVTHLMNCTYSERGQQS